MRKMATSRIHTSGVYSGSFVAWESEAVKVHRPAFGTWYGIRESSPFILKYIFLWRNGKDGGQREEQLGTSENSLFSFSFPSRKQRLGHH